MAAACQLVFKVRPGPGLAAAGRARTQKEWVGRLGTEPTQSLADRLEGFRCYSAEQGTLGGCEQRRAGFSRCWLLLWRQPINENEGEAGDSSEVPR